MDLTEGEIRQKLRDLEERIENLCGTVDYEGLIGRKSELEKRMSQAGFWDDLETANKLVRELRNVKRASEEIASVKKTVSEARELLELASEENDKALLGEVEGELRKGEEGLSELEIAAILNGPYDKESAFLSVHAGAGGTDAADWAEMLARMYMRWCEKQGYDTDVVDRVPGEEAGVRQLTLNVKGLRAYGYLKAEIGVHRLVRISPFDAKKRRHTSFAAVDVIPDAGEEIDVEIQESDLRVDTFRSSGAGGQHVNVTDSAVRITHEPSGITVQCQNERSQHMNKAMAMKMLRARLLQLEEEKREESLKKAYDEKGQIAWGNQIRSYVLHPYTLVKDHRTNHDYGNVDAVLDGELMPFIEKYLEKKRSERSSTGEGGDGPDR